MKKTVIALALGLLWSVAEAQRPMTADDVLALKQVGDAQISPDGKWVAYTVSAVDLAQNATNSDLWLVATAGGDPIRLTTNPKADGQPRWSPDGRWIAFVSAREDRPQIWLIRPNGGEPEKLTDSKTGVQGFQWSPDGRTIAYVALRAATPEEEKKEKEKDDAIVVDRDFRFTRLWTIDVGSKQATEVVAGNFQLGDPQWSPDGTRIAYTVTPTPKADDGTRSDIHIVTLATKATRKLLENNGPDNGARWSPDGRWIAFLSRGDTLRSFGQQRLVVVSAEGGTPRAVAPNFLYQPGPVTWSSDGATLYFSASVRTTSQLFSVPVAGGQPTQLSRIKGTMGGPTWSDDGRVAAMTVADIQHPNEVHVVKDLARFAPERLTDHNPQLKDVALGRGETVRWKSKDGMEIEGVVVYPVGYDPSRRYPTMAFIHGGPSGVWTEGFPGSWGNYAHVWAGQGWVSFFPNVRGSSGYGEAFLKANVRDWGGGDYQDIQTGLDDLVRRGVADSTRLGQAGWSYGGYMTAWTLTQTNRFKGVMVGAGLTNMYSMYSTNDLQTTLENYFGAEPWDDEQAYRRASAMVYIKQAKTPTLILHGQQDTRVPIGQAQELYMGLKKNDVPVTLVFYPREGHGLGEPRHQIDKMKREYAFFAKTVLGIDVKDKPDLVP
ncbi:MAG: S9 family peptidase [Gemmatimonadales bacterium]|nr:S9 family peptidase [Gemmatimonadales bacterium]